MTKSKESCCLSMDPGDCDLQFRELAGQPAFQYGDNDIHIASPLMYCR